MELAAARGQRLASVLVGAAVAFALAALVLSYVADTVLEPRPFADRAVAALRSPAVQEDVAERLSDAIINASGGDLAAVGPLVRSVSSGIVASGAFSALVRHAMLDIHRSIVAHDGRTIRLNVGDAAVLAEAALQRLNPGLAKSIGAERIASLVKLQPAGALLRIVRLAARARTAAWVLAALAVLAAIGGLAAAPDRRLAAFRLGLWLAAGALVLVALLAIGRLIAEQSVPNQHRGVAGAVWSAFLGGLRTQALWLAAGGAVCAAAASGRVQPMRLDQRLLARLRLLTAQPGSRGTRLALAGGAIALALALLLAPLQTLTLAAQAAGLLLLYRGIEALLVETAPASGAASARPPQRRARARPSLRLGGSRRVLAPVLAVLALAVVAVLIIRGGGDGAPAQAATGCNGHVSLCDRRLEEVTLPATHNSMASTTIPSWLFGQQDGTISEQLDDGVRGLLIDSYHGSAVAGGVRTDLQRETGAKRKLAEAEVGEPEVAAALRIRERLAPQGAGKPGIFLCHTFCELGAVPMPSALADIRRFLVEHPGEVLVLINQDEGVTPKEVEKQFRAAGLLGLVYKGPPGPFPTLRQMIDNDERLVVLSENEADPAVPWYHRAYDHALQETPYRFRSAWS
jgi:hypothetical protein